MNNMKNYVPLIHAIQAFLRAEMKSARLTYDEVFGPLGYADKSGIARLLTRNRLYLEDVLKLMVLCKTKTLAVSAEGRNLRISLKCGHHNDIDDLIAALRLSIQQEPGTEGISRLKHGVTWADVAEKASSTNRQWAHYTWFQRQTPIALVFVFLDLGFDMSASTPKAKVSFQLS